MAFAGFINYVRKAFVSERDLLIAVEQNKTEKLSNFFDMGFSVDHYVDGFTPLQYSLLFEVPAVTVFLLKKNADPNLICKTDNELRKGRTLQPYLRFGGGYVSPITFERNRSVIRLLVLHGAVAGEGEDALKFEHDVFKAVFNEAQILQMEIKKREDLLTAKDLLGDDGLEQKLQACMELEKIWLLLSQQESSPDFEPYKNYYKEKAGDYEREAVKYRLALAKRATAEAHKESKEKIADVALNSPVAYYASPLSSVRSEQIRVEKAPLLGESGLRQRKLSVLPALKL